MKLIKEDQEALAKLYTEAFDDHSGGHNGSTDGQDDHAYQDTWESDLINSEEYQSVAALVNELRNMDDRLVWKSILSINAGDKNKILDAMQELGVNPRFKANTGGAFDRGED